MDLNALKKEIDELVSKGYGSAEVLTTEPNNPIALWSIKGVSIEDTVVLDGKNELTNKEVIVIGCGSVE